MENPVQPVAYDDEIDLWQLWDTIWSGRWLVVAITSLFAVGAVAYALVAQEWYRAEVVLAPADKKGGMSGALSQLSGLASLAGVSVGGGKAHALATAVAEQPLARRLPSCPCPALPRRPTWMLALVVMSAQPSSP